VVWYGGAYCELLVCAVGFGQHSLASNITLLRAVEVDEIFEGNDDKYKALTVSSDVIIQRYNILSCHIVVYLNVLHFLNFYCSSHVFIAVMFHILSLLTVCTVVSFFMFFMCLC